MISMKLEAFKRNLLEHEMKYSLKETNDDFLPGEVKEMLF
jgi:hypothetical protein